MLFHTFSHIPGIGGKTERALWDAGIHTWDDFREPYPPRLSRQRTALIRHYLDQGRQALGRSPRYFAERLSASQLWRLFPHYRHACAYLDIETDGLGQGASITTIALYDGATVHYYAQGCNLERFVHDIGRYEVLVTYNGKAFDAPVIERFFNIRLDQVHIDLRHILHNLGIKGGLKGCEKQLGLDRGDLDGVDGFLAVLLWRQYQRTGKRSYLETLLAYNIEDAVNLETLMVHAYNRNLATTPFGQGLALPLPRRPLGPFAVDREIVRQLQG